MKPRELALTPDRASPGESRHSHRRRDGRSVVAAQPRDSAGHGATQGVPADGSWALPQARVVASSDAVTTAQRATRFTVASPAWCGSA